jgi:putative oxidoreductase
MGFLTGTMAEFFGGLGLILGVLTRLAAFGIAVNMLVAVVMVHARFGLFANWSGTQKGEGIGFHLLVLAMTVFLMLKVAGALSMDRKLAQ